MSALLPSTRRPGGAMRLPHRDPQSLVGAAVAVLVAGALLPAAVGPAVAASGTTAWHNGGFAVDTPNVVRRSDVVLGAPNSAAAQSLPLGNGALGAAVWAA